jgi:hypothetical protein
MLTIGMFLRWLFNQRTLFKIVRGLFASEETDISFSATSRPHAGFCSVRWIPEDLSRDIWWPQHEANQSCTSGKGKGKAHPTTGHEDPEVDRGIDLLFL